MNDEALTPLERARKATRTMRERGEPIVRRNPIQLAAIKTKSKTMALRAYYWQHHGVVENQGTEDGAVVRQDAEGDYAKARQKSHQIGLPAVIKEICYHCEAGGIDPGARERVRNCGAPRCALHPVRPWQRIRGRKKIAEAKNIPLKVGV